jgi:hypothetical protein
MLSSEDKSLWEKFIAGVLPKFAASREPTYAPQCVSQPIRDVRFCPSLDLHGYTVANAHSTFGRYMVDAKNSTRRTVIIITGRSGQIRNEFPMWAEAYPEWHCEAINSGSFRLKRKKSDLPKPA